MNITKFKQLENHDQYEMLWEHGVMIGDREVGMQRIVLYQIFGFYVELYYDTQFNVIRRSASFDEIGMLDGYLDQFTITKEDLT